MTAKEALKHPWLINKKQLMTRVGCSSCPSIIQNQQNKKNLRKYLSKSREALFEKVISASKQQQENLRKTALLKFNKTRRLCESQMSLVSKTREKSLGDMSISLGRSKEKLYGLKCLSKSQEVLNLYKSMKDISNVCIDEIIKNINESKTIENNTKANENDKVETESLNNQNNNNVESNNKHRESANKQKSPTRKEINSEPKSRRSPDKNARRPSRESVEKTRLEENDNVAKLTDSKIDNCDNRNRKRENDISKRAKKTDIYSRQSSKEDAKESTVRKLSREENKDIVIVRKTSRDETKNIQNRKSSRDETSNGQNRKYSKDETRTADRKLSRDESKVLNNRRPSREENKVLTERKISREENGNAVRKVSREETKVHVERKLSRDDSKDSNISKLSREDIKDTNIRRISRDERIETMSHTSSDDASSVDDDSLEYLPGVYDEDCYDDEPKFSVKQLISAYNYNEEVAKRNIVPTNSRKFPIGPNALRLFIPNIDITSKKLALRKKTFIVRNHFSMNFHINNNNGTNTPSHLS